MNHKGNLIITVPLYSYKKNFQRYITLQDMLEDFRKLDLIESIFFKETNGIYIETNEQNQEPMSACFVFHKP